MYDRNVQVDQIQKIKSVQSLSSSNKAKLVLEGSKSSLFFAKLLYNDAGTQRFHTGLDW